LQIKIEKVKEKATSVLQHPVLNPKDHRTDTRLSLKKRKLLNKFKKEILAIYQSNDEQTPPVIDRDDIKNLLDMFLDEFPTPENNSITDNDLKTFLERITNVLRVLRSLSFSYKHALNEYETELEKGELSYYEQNNKMIYLDYVKQINLSDIKSSNKNLNKLLFMSSIFHYLEIVLSYNLTREEVENITDFVVYIMSNPLSSDTLEQYKLLMTQFQEGFQHDSFNPVAFEQEIENIKHDIDDHTFVFLEFININESVDSSNCIKFIKIINDILKIKIEEYYNNILLYAENLNDSVIDLEKYIIMSSKTTLERQYESTRTLYLALVSRFQDYIIRFTKKADEILGDR